MPARYPFQALPSRQSLPPSGLAATDSQNKRTWPSPTVQGGGRCASPAGRAGEGSQPSLTAFYFIFSLFFLFLPEAKGHWVANRSSLGGEQSTREQSRFVLRARV